MGVAEGFVSAEEGLHRVGPTAVPALLCIGCVRRHGAQGTTGDAREDR